jgi:hypothetical protein
MFVIALEMFSIGTITILTHTKHVPKSICIPNIFITELVPKQLVKLVGISIIKLIIPLDIVKQHLPKTFFPSKGWRDDWR